MKVETSHETRLIDGKRIAADILRDVKVEAQQLKAKGLQPGLAVVLAGDDPASRVYVRSKLRTCDELGLYSEQRILPERTTTEELLSVTGELNRSDAVDGILVQLPLPDHIEADKVLFSVHPAKDVDGFHPTNVGKLCLDRPQFVPCTPAGIIEMLRREKIPMAGRQAVVIGRSNIVGKPLALLLLRENCTVTICHSKTQNLPQVASGADILIAAVGRAGLVTAEFIKPGATVVDVGVNRITDPEQARSLCGEDSRQFATLRERGSCLVGDVHPREARGVAGALTPVPGGVGPLTIAMLMSNTVRACRLRRLEGRRRHS